MDALTARLGLERIAVVGTRLGATLATLAAQGRNDVEALALWQPVVSGPELVEETHRLAAAGPDGAHGVELGGYPLTDALAKDLAGVDLRNLPAPPAARVLVLENALEGEPGSLEAFARGLGGDAEYRRSADAGVWLRDLFESVVPVATLETLVDWIEEVYP